ncbi:hypothetical protein LA345_39165 (plasmid) [Burkholderia vietnamiensis]|uniref:Uncharacterized protein n=1 Tax=Burkholderia vietnamiensis (strain G4 / LMG 22486) TaxID=269482 RepID=A4JWJ2_BURVG|nr:hypothetical protein Bcep1808_7775 [Burkholderia vietnamiensis G4]MCB4349821.1 hypothetical protein [Burkholderia vietnamiensis]
MSDLIPVDSPSLQPLQQSFERDQLESELKAVFLAVFESMIRANERRLNLYGMPHLGDAELVERALKDSGLAIVKRDVTRSSFLLQAARARNPRRGMIFLKQYLQAVWPNVWLVEPLWHPLATSANYPADRTPLGTKTLTNGVSAVYDMASNPEGLPTVYKTDWQGKTQLYTTPRTNSLTYSGPIDNAAWVKTLMTATANAAVAPDGTQTAAKIADSDTSNAAHSVQHSSVSSQNAADWNTWSIYVQAVERRYVVLRLIASGASSNYCAAYFDLLTGNSAVVNAGKATGAKATITSLGVNGWWRVSVSGIPNPNVASQGIAAFIGAPPSFGNTTVYAGVVGQGINAWGGQLEAGGAPTRYIGTTGAAVTVTDYTVNANGVAHFSDGVTADAPLTHFRTGRIRVTLPVSSDNGLGLLEIAKAFRSTLAPRLMLELRLSTLFENKGAAGGLALANGAKAIMPLMAIGKIS